MPTAVNAINTTTNASISGSSVTSAATAITLAASLPTGLNIDAKVLAAALSVGIGAGGIGAAIGVALARNLIGSHPDGSAGSAQVEAFITNSNVTATDALQQLATSSATITAEVVSGALAVGGGLIGIGLAGAGVDITNDIAMNVEAYIANAAANTVTAGALVLSARDTSSITATANGVAISAALGIVGIAVSVGAAIANNRIDNQVLAYVSGPTTGTASVSTVAHATTESAAAISSETACSSAPGTRTVGRPGRPTARPA